jgi:hypothetical protein
MKIEYSFSPEVIKAMWRHYRGYTTISIANARVWYVAAPTISLALLLSGLCFGYTWLQTQGWKFFFASLVGIPIHLAFDKWKFSNWVKNGFLQGTEGGIYSLIANENELIVAKPDSIETRLSWSAITNIIQNEVITIMYLSLGDCFYFPTNAMTTEQRADFDKLIAEHVTRGKS